MRVGLVSYQVAHQKTLDVTRALFGHGHEVVIFIFPFKFRPPPIGPRRYQDRPWQLIGEPITDGRAPEFVEIGGWTDEFAPRLSGCDIYLHCTAKIIPASFIKGRTILNCHPGLLPENRGVDAFKWSLVNGWPIGVTLHVIDEEIDRGMILKRMPVPVFATDTLADVCQRMYDFEIDLLGNFEHHLDGERVPVGDDYPCSHAMIPIEQDRRLAEIFEDYKRAIPLVVDQFE